MGMSDEDLSSVFRVISAALLFGNMEFKQERNTDQATLPDNTVAQKVSNVYSSLAENPEYWNLEFQKDSMYVGHAKKILQKYYECQHMTNILSTTITFSRISKVYFDTFMVFFKKSSHYEHIQQSICDGTYAMQQFAGF